MGGCCATGGSNVKNGTKEVIHDFGGVEKKNKNASPNEKNGGIFE
jgi:hypothetical protein